ncbi:polysaccharide biosynthesis/export family protein [Leptolyngbya sp. FACHB-261]|uniref:polysaccharide biosynthesis/export family protein n=1 Tax=Leptolyngbya sp. FACHB-261 TaxID=2692806 RepID=UPI0016842922|nr:polysaccharide biosynthesis/export family protein [Leptolyngbya sp. FACHB-261]MBD2105028.1 polysaccharide export protein [Leptolyngbya sp. FACHB-261]
MKKSALIPLSSLAWTAMAWGIAQPVLAQANSIPPPAPTLAAPRTGGPFQLDIGVRQDRYRLGPGDGVNVSVPRFPDLNFSSSVDPDGNVTAPLVGPVTISGLTLQEAAQRLETALNRYVIDPEVTVSLTTQRPVGVNIVGEVKKPGLYQAQVGNDTVNRGPALLITQAGGATTYADLRDVRIRRTLANGEVIERQVDLFTPLTTGSPLPNVRLEDGDTILVSRLSADDRTYNQQLVARSNLATPTISIRVLNYAGGRGGSGRRSIGGDGGGNLTSVQLPNGSTFADAIAQINPSLDNARLSRVGLIRFDPQQGKPIATVLDAREVLKGDPGINVPLQDSDVVVINRNLLARITYVLNTITRPFRDVLDFTSFIDDAADVVGGGNGDDD